MWTTDIVSWDRELRSQRHAVQGKTINIVEFQFQVGGLRLQRVSIEAL